jgi:four helix bundle protein
MKDPIGNHKNLKIWNRARELVLDIYRLTERYPKSETFILVSQMRRAAISVASNISEGAARLSTKGYIRFLLFSAGSLAELETQLILSGDLGFIHSNEDEIKDLNTKIHILRKQLYATIRSLREKISEHQ